MEGRPLHPLKPPSLGVRSHMLLILGVKPPPPPPAALVPMFFCTSGVELTDCDPRRIKSTRAACMGSYMGSLIVRATCPKSPEYRFLSASRRFLMIHIRPKTPRAPMTIPGKKPAANALPSKPPEDDCVDGATQPEVCDAEAGFVADGEGELDGGEIFDLLREHMPPLHM